MKLTAKEQRLIRFALERLAHDHEQFALAGGPRGNALSRAGEARRLMERLEAADRYAVTECDAQSFEGHPA